MKICTDCKIEKSLDSFYKRSSKAGGGRQSICKDCWKGQNKRYYQNDEHKKAIRVTEINRRKNLREYVYSYYSTHPCVDCEESNPVVLEFDHVRGEKIGGIAMMINHAGVSLEKIKLEIEKCEVRCANCHRKRTAKTQNWYKQ